MNLRDYLFPHDLEECLAALNAWEGRGRLVAGGTDLVGALEYGKSRVVALIDVGSVRDLAGFEIRDKELVIRAGATHGEISEHPRIQQVWPALAKACGSVGSPQIRNVATLAGNVVNAQPAADSAVALVALDETGKVLLVRQFRVAAGRVLVEIPANFLALKSADSDLAQQWRLHSRTIFETLFEHGYLVTDFVYLPGNTPRSFYVLSYGESTL